RRRPLAPGTIDQAQRPIHLVVGAGRELVGALAADLDDDAVRGPRLHDVGHVQSETKAIVAGPEVGAGGRRAYGEHGTGLWRLQPSLPKPSLPVGMAGHERRGPMPGRRVGGGTDRGLDLIDRPSSRADSESIVTETLGESAGSAGGRCVAAPPRARPTL